MKRAALTAVLITAAAAGAQRVDEYDDNVKPITNRVAVLAELPDGGCMLAETCGRLQSKDGGSVIQGCEPVRKELGGANRTTCLNVLQKTGNLWCNRQSACVSDSGL